MKSIIEVYSGILILLISVFAGVTVVAATEMVEQAESYKASVIAEVENSNFNPDVIAGCAAEASALGYDLEVRGYTYDALHDIQTAEVVLTYEYQMPLFGIHETRTVRGIAR